MIPAQKSGKIPGYDLSSPDFRIILPGQLHEISGMTLINSSSFACIEDEDGILFIYDLVKREIKKSVPFWDHGDYEGLARVSDTIYVLRSDGILFEIAGYDSGKPDITPYATGIPKSDNEGVCYDKYNKRLLITCKPYIGRGSKTKHKRVIFGFDLKTKQLSSDPVYSFDLRDFEEFAKKHDIELHLEPDKKKTNDEYILHFHPSDIAIHPLTGDLYILSAIDHSIAVFKNDGKLKHLAILDPYLFNQAEGITFLDNGDMLISNEGGNGRPTLLRFNYRKN